MVKKRFFFIFFYFSSMLHSFSLISLNDTCYTIINTLDNDNIYSYNYKQKKIVASFISIDKKKIYYITFSSVNKKNENHGNNILAKINIIIDNNQISYPENLYVDNKKLLLNNKGQICFKSGFIYDFYFVRKNNNAIKNKRIFKAY